MGKEVLYESAGNHADDKEHRLRLLLGSEEQSVHPTMRATGSD